MDESLRGESQQSRTVTTVTWTSLSDGSHEPDADHDESRKKHASPWPDTSASAAGLPTLDRNQEKQPLFLL